MSGGGSSGLFSGLGSGRLLLVVVMMVVLMASGAEAQEESFSHHEWAGVLERFVDEEGKVDYRGLEKEPAGLDRYLAQLAEVSPESHPNLFPTRDSALAYYINAYNAFVFRGVLELGTEVESVWPTLLAGYKFFISRKFSMGGKEIHLKALEDDQVREEFGDPRIHAALNCASFSCPRLPAEPFEPETLDTQLEAAMTEFVAAHVQVDGEKKTAHLSKIFDWFESDFLEFEKAQSNAPGRPNLIDYVNRFRGDDEQIPRTFKIRFLPYDKGLNRQ